MQRKNYNSGAPWEEIVGYSRAVRVGNFVYVSGCTGIDASGKVVDGGVYAQTKQTLLNVAKGLEGVGAELRHVVRTRMFVSDISAWQEVAKAHAEVFGNIKPSTSMLEISRFISPEMLVEIEADAVITE